MSGTRKILGESASVKEMLGMIARVANAKTNILVIGESGTGKELVARMIHDSGPLKERPFVPVNCGAIPENLIESEMFGHRRGSFTGAVNEKIGLFEAAHGGTLFLDEVGELPLALQVKLLRAIQEKSIRRVGGNEDIRVDVRIIAATNRDLEAAVAKGVFREDLYYRLNVILIRTPPLRERKGDVRILAEQFLKRCLARYGGKGPSTFLPETMKFLESYSWPGNVRELENVIERSVTLESGPAVTTDSLPDSMQALVRNSVAAHPSVQEQASSSSSSASGLSLPAAEFSRGPLPLRKILREAERTYLAAALKHAEGDRKKAAALVGLNLKILQLRMAKLELE